MNYKFYDKIRALAGNWVMYHNDYTWNTVMRNGEILRGVQDLNPYLYQYFTIEPAEGATESTQIRLEKDENAPSVTYYWSKDGGEHWNSRSSAGTWNLNPGQKLMFKSETARWGQINDPTPESWHFAGGAHKAYGNIMSLVWGDNFIGKTRFHDNATNAFYGLFKDDSYLQDATDLMLPATTLSKGCYAWMFSGCSRLELAPELPATTLGEACYECMFYGCSLLVTAPVLNATTLGDRCYWRMFEDCTSLTTVQATLPATALTTGCYCQMFKGCTSLVVAPVLPAAILVTTCYQYMFNDCTSLNYITCLATNVSADNCIQYWVMGINTYGTFYKHPNALWEAATNNNYYQGYPSNWTVQDAS